MLSRKDCNSPYFPVFRLFSVFLPSRGCRVRSFFLARRSNTLFRSDLRITPRRPAPLPSFGGCDLICYRQDTPSRSLFPPLVLIILVLSDLAPSFRRLFSYKLFRHFTRRIHPRDDFPFFSLINMEQWIHRIVMLPSAPLAILVFQVKSCHKGIWAGMSCFQAFYHRCRSPKPWIQPPFSPGVNQFFLYVHQIS